MDIVLLAMTVVSLIVAFVMSVAAWRLTRDERARSAARVAALSAAAAEPDGSAWQQAKVPATEPATERAPVGDPRPAAPWSTTRVSAFGTPARPQSSTRSAAVREAEPVMRPVFAEEFAPSPNAVIGDSFLGSGSNPAGNSRQRGLAIAAVILFAVVAGAGFWTVVGDRSSGAGASAKAAESAPLELVSLRHERRGARLAVTGLVRNPVAGEVVDKLTAVVFLFDPKGAFITSARTQVDFLKLVPGDESPFVIDVEAPANVARYRVSFRNDEGIVPHIDRRGEEPVAPNAVSQNTAATR